MSIKLVKLVFLASIKPPSYKLMLASMAEYADDDGRRVFPSMKTLAARASVSHSQAQRIVRALEKMQIISVVGNAAGGAPGCTPRYQLHIDKIQEWVPTGSAAATGSVDATHSTSESEGLRGGTQGVARMQATDSCAAARPTINPQISTTEAAMKVPLGFEEFWSVYPRKEKHFDAQCAFEELAPSPELQREIVNAVRCQAQLQKWTKDDGRYVPYAANYLRRRQWADQVDSTGHHAQKPWYESAPGIRAKGEELGVGCVGSDLSGHEWMHFTARVWAVAGDGPHWDEKSHVYPLARELRNKVAPEVGDLVKTRHGLAAQFAPPHIAR